MSYNGIQTNLDVMYVINSLRQTAVTSNTSMERLSTGSQINHAVDSPSGIAILDCLRGQIRGMEKAIQNIQDVINLIHTADSAIAQINQLQISTRNLFVKAANAATMSYESLAEIFYEVGSIGNSIYQIAQSTTFNDKRLLDGSFRNMDIQVGGNNGQFMRITIDIPDFDDATFSGAIPPPPPLFPFPPGTPVSFISGAFAALIDVSDKRIGNVVGVRSELGQLETRLESILDELTAEKIGAMSAKSNISDADFSKEYISMIKSKLIMETSARAFAQAVKAPYLNLVFFEIFGLFQDEE